MAQQRKRWIYKFNQDWVNSIHCPLLEPFEHLLYYHVCIFEPGHAIPQNMSVLTFQIVYIGNIKILPSSDLLITFFFWIFVDFDSFINEHLNMLKCVVILAGCMQT